MRRLSRAREALARGAWRSILSSRATAADELVTPKLDEGIKDRAAKKTTKHLHHSV